MKSRLDKIRKERASRYGKFPSNMDALGKMWTAILEHHYRIKFSYQIPTHILALMQAQIKICRAANPSPHHQDNYDDAINYLKLAEESSAPIGKDLPQPRPASIPEKSSRGHIMSMRRS